jgi:AcrR family transcriptional regulator
MKIKNSQCHRSILVSTRRLLETTPSEHLRISDIAEDAHVSVPTIYYHFATRQSLIAEAQALVYQYLSEPLHQSLLLAELSILKNNEATFWRVVGRHLVLAWSSGQSDVGQGIVKVLRDVRSDPKTRNDFDVVVNDSFARWVRLFEEAQRLGWTEQGIDIGALVVSFWAASVGQSIVGNPCLMEISPERMRDLFLGFVKARAPV